MAWKKTPTYQSWDHMKQRCLNPNNDSYASYGGRGITVCERWLTFENFLADMGERPKRKSIERVDNDKGYYPENCVWATRQRQQLNRGIQSNNTSGVVGVYYDKSRDQWEARIAELRLGRFNTKDEAITARKKWEAEYGLL
jgi:hypothetical protein